MQLYIIEWSFQNNEDQLFATNEFCHYFNEWKLNESIDGFVLLFIAHTQHNGSGVILCKLADVIILFRIFNMWRKNFNISFNFKPALTDGELAYLHTESLWEKVWKITDT